MLASLGWFTSSPSPAAAAAAAIVPPSQAQDQKQQASAKRSPPLPTHSDATDDDESRASDDSPSEEGGRRTRIKLGPSDSSGSGEPSTPTPALIPTKTSSSSSSSSPTQQQHRMLLTDDDANEIYGQLDEMGKLTKGGDPFKARPVIIVVGSENCGKSTVLNAIAQWNILPTGSGLCTRCPIRVVMRFDATTVSAKVGFRNTVNNVLTPVQVPADAVAARNLVDVVRQAHELALKLDNNNQGISTVMEVVVEMSGPTLSSFDLYDLPGLVTVAGGQLPKNTPQHAHSLAISTITDNKDRCFILAVEQAAVTSNSALAMQVVNDTGTAQHTLGVLTKCDSVAESSEQAELLRSGILSESHASFFTLAPHGYVATMLKPGTDDVLVSETRFFEKHPVLRAVLQKERAGVAAATKRINTMHDEYMREKWIPVALQQADAFVLDAVAKLRAMGSPVAFSSAGGNSFALAVGADEDREGEVKKMFKEAGVECLPPIKVAETVLHAYKARLGSVVGSVLQQDMVEDAFARITDDLATIVNASRAKKTNLASVDDCAKFLASGAKLQADLLKSIANVVESDLAGAFEKKWKATMDSGDEEDDLDDIEEDDGDNDDEDAPSMLLSRFTAVTSSFTTKLHAELESASKRFAAFVEHRFEAGLDPETYEDLHLGALTQCAMRELSVAVMNVVDAHSAEALVPLLHDAKAADRADLVRRVLDVRACADKLEAFVQYE